MVGGGEEGGASVIMSTRKKERENYMGFIILEKNKEEMKDK